MARRNMYHILYNGGGGKGLALVPTFLPFNYV